jgi:hypothetical protein
MGKILGGGRGVWQGEPRGDGWGWRGKGWDGGTGREGREEERKVRPNHSSDNLRAGGGGRGEEVEPRRRHSMESSTKAGRLWWSYRGGERIEGKEEKKKKEVGWGKKKDQEKISEPELMMDSLKVKQILVNLISNGIFLFGGFFSKFLILRSFICKTFFGLTVLSAVKFTETGGITVRTKIILRAGKDALVIIKVIVCSF